MQSKQTFSCSLPGKRSISIASNSMARSSSAPRPKSSGESGPENSTRISGRSQSRSSAIGGSTVMQYFNRSPPCLTIPDRSSLILFAAPILSGMAIGSSQLSALSSIHCCYQHYHASVGADEIIFCRKPIADSRKLLILLSRPFRRHLTHLLSQRRAVHDGLLRNRNQIAQGVIQIQAGGKIKKYETHHKRHHHVHHLLLLRIHARLRRHSLRRDHANHQQNRQDKIRVARRKIVYPEPMRMPEFDGSLQHFVISKDERKLDHERQTAADGIHAFPFV